MRVSDEEGVAETRYDEMRVTPTLVLLNTWGKEVENSECGQAKEGYKY